MGSGKKITVVLFVIGIGLFGYSQYASASQIAVEITQSELIEKNEKESKYDVELKFQNPSLLFLNAGETEFFIISNDDVVGKGQLESFVLPSLGSSFVNGVFTTNSDSEESLKITGVTKYEVLVISIDIPFIYYPTEEQAREFIHQN